METNKWMINPKDAVMLLIDHQSGLFQLVRDIDQPTLRSHVIALAKVSRLAKIPTFTTASVPDGPNGPLMPEIHQAAPHAIYVSRKGEVNAWDNEDFVKAVKATKKRQLLIAGVVTEVCVAFPALSALEEGYEVFVVTDASGTFNQTTRDAAWSRMEAAGAQLMSWFGIACELHRDWRNDIEGLGRLFSNHLPNYRNLINSYTAAKGNGERAPSRAGRRGMQPAGMGK